MNSLLNLLNSRLLSAIGAPLLLALVAFLFVRDVRRIRRGEPITIWYWSAKIHPGEAMRPWAVAVYLSPYFVLVGVILVAAGAGLFTMAFPPRV
jgi:hypothetical protein